MKLFGGFGSPFTRRVGTTLRLYGLEQHIRCAAACRRNWNSSRSSIRRVGCRRWRQTRAAPSSIAPRSWTTSTNWSTGEIPDPTVW